MRWFWLDKFEKFQSGVQSQAIKCITLAEDHMHDHFPYFPVMPHSLALEGIAQTSGLLVCEYYKYKQKVVLAKINKAVFHCLAYPGDTIVYKAVIERIEETGTVSSATAYIRKPDGQEVLFAEVEMMHGILDDSYSDIKQFGASEWRHMMVGLKVYEVGVEADGVTPLQEPEEFKNLD